MQLLQATVFSTAIQILGWILVSKGPVSSALMFGDLVHGSRLLTGR